MLAVALTAADLELEVVFEESSVAQAGEGVVVGEMTQALLQALTLGDVLELHDVVQRERRRRSRTSEIASSADMVSPAALK